MCERGLRGTGWGGGVVSVVLHVELLLLSKNMNEYEFVSCTYVYTLQSLLCTSPPV